jgi:AAA family ATP:ADP antiporter
LSRRLGIDLREGEGTAAVLLFLCFFLFITFQYTTKSVRQSTFINALGAAKLPYVYLLVALCSYPILRLYGRFADRMRRHQLIAGTCFVIALSMVGFWWLYQFPWPWVPFVFYVWVSIVYVMNVSQFWSLSNHVLDPRQAKRLFGFIGTGGLLGGIAGGQVARLATNLVGTRYALLVAAVIVFSVVALIYAVHRMSPADEARVAGAAGLAKLDKSKGGFDAICQSRHLQLIAAVLGLTVVVAQIVDLQFNWAVEQATTGLDQQTTFFGNFYSVMGISAVLFQLVFTARIHRALGVGIAMRILPSTMAFGTVALFVAAGMWPAALVLAALVLKVGENGLRYSLDQATRELLFLPVPSAARLKAKAFIDVFVQRGAKGLAALLLLPVTFGLLTAVQAGWLSLALIAVWLAVAAAMYREYVRSFRSGLKRRTVDVEVPIDVADITTLELLVESLGSADRRQVLQSIDLLAANQRAKLVSPLLLYHDDPLVRRRTLEVLAEGGRRDVVALVERRLGDDDVEVRTLAIRTLIDLKGAEPCEVMMPRLGDGDPAVRASAVACLVNHGDETMAKQAEGALADMLCDADPSVRSEAAKAIGAVHEPEFQGQLLQLLYDAEPAVVREAMSAVRRRVARDGFVPVYSPRLISLLQNRRLKHDARESLVALGEPVIPALTHFMNDREEQIWVRRALPKTIARFGTPAAAKALAESLSRAKDAFLRRKVIDALGSIGDSDLLADHAGQIERAVHFEARRYMQELLDLTALDFTRRGRLDGPLVEWNSTEEEPSLLDRLLDERMADSLNNVFRLLAMLHPPDGIRAAHRSLISGQPALRNHALEYLDNTLSGEVRRNVFAVIDDTPAREKFKRAEKLFGVSARSKIETLGAVLSQPRDGDRDAAALGVAAVYAVYEGRVAELFPNVQTLSSEAAHPFIRETAAWVCRRLNLAGP